MSVKIVDHAATPQLTKYLFKISILIMKIDTGPFLNGEISFDGKAVIIKSCDTFVWSKLCIWLNYYYHYEYPNTVQPNETCIIEYSNFILPKHLRACEPPMPTQYDGKETDVGLERLHYAITLETEEGHNYIDLFQDNTIYKFTSNRKNVVLSYTRD
jgi:hypothetical protein